jgi:hypothetical protein
VKRDEFLLTQSEKDRIIKILNRAVAKADGNLSPTEISITEDNPEGCKFDFYIQWPAGPIHKATCQKSFNC